MIVMGEHNTAYETTLFGAPSLKLLQWFLQKYCNVGWYDNFIQVMSGCICYLMVRQTVCSTSRSASREF